MWEGQLDESGLVVELGGGQQPPSLSIARHLWSNCSCVIALHPDQAAESAVRFAVEFGKAFAVVPCCVYSKEFTQRRLPGGRCVRTYEDLVEYLVSLAPGRAKVGTLPFEGK